MRLTQSRRSPILEATIRKSNREEVQFKLDDSHYPSGQLPMNWKILEHNDGVIIQVVYIGTENEEFRLIGTIEGQKTIHISDRLPKPIFSTSEIILFVITVCTYIIGIYSMKHIDPLIEWIQSRPKMSKLFEIDPITFLYGIGCLLLIIVTVKIAWYIFYPLMDTLPIDF